MKNYIVLTYSVALIVLGPFCISAQDLVKYVQPMSGTAASTTVSSLKHGGGSELNANTIPAVTMPFAMTQWSPQTQATEKKCIPPYYYKDSMINGFRGSHWISGSCMQDYGSFTIMPVTGRLKTTSAALATPYKHSHETSTPYLYKVTLPGYALTAEITSTLRCGLMQFTVNRNDSLYLVVTPNSDFGEGFIRVD